MMKSAPVAMRRVKIIGNALGRDFLFVCWEPGWCIGKISSLKEADLYRDRDRSHKPALRRKRCCTSVAEVNRKRHKKNELWSDGVGSKVALLADELCFTVTTYNNRFPSEI